MRDTTHEPLVLDALISETIPVIGEALSCYSTAIDEMVQNEMVQISAIAVMDAIRNGRVDVDRNIHRKGRGTSSDRVWDLLNSTLIDPPCGVGHRQRIVIATHYTHPIYSRRLQAPAHHLLESDASTSAMVSATGRNSRLRVPC